MKPFLRCSLAATAILLAACGDSDNPTLSSVDLPGDDGQAASNLKWSTYERADEFPGTVAMPQEWITMRDGTRLSAKVTLPADAAGNAVTTPMPVILTQTGYNKGLPIIDAANPFLVRHGYAHLSVDVRGTGNSEGQWESFSRLEQEDYLEVIDWASRQAWSNGAVGTWGASFMAITQLFTAQWQHPAHKAAFAIVPAADVYRDITFQGGQTNAGFIPVWLGLVTVLSLVPPAGLDPSALPIMLEHLQSAITHFQVPVILQGTLGVNGQAYDGEFYRTRSPIEVIEQVKVPTFIVGGLNDIFQRGEPLLYEALRDHTTSKLLIGPWQHVAGSSGEGLPRDDVPDLDHLALAWFDRYLKNMDSGAERMPPVTQYYWGEEKYLTSTDWPHPQARADRWYLRAEGALTREAPAAGEGSTTLLQQPLNGICSTSTSQWTAGLLGMLPVQPSCLSQNTLNEALFEATFTTAVAEEDYVINGPIEADLWIATTAQDASVLVRVTEVTADGVSRERTNGILTASLRKVDESRSRYLDGQRIQPWHPFTAESAEPVPSGEAILLPIEIFPTSLVVKKGSRLRITVGASDFPHGVPPLTQYLNMPAGVLTVFFDAGHPSSIVVPAVPLSAI
jgi:uncharacterized protein